MVDAVYNYAVSKEPKTKLLFGLDANTYASPEKDQQGVLDFADFYNSLKLNSCYGHYPNPRNYTTFNARTHLQPQLNKVYKYYNYTNLFHNKSKNYYFLKLYLFNFQIRRCFLKKKT